MINYIRYIFVILLLGLLFFSYTIQIQPSTYKSAIEKKLPMIIKKKGIVATIKNIDIIDTTNNIIDSKIQGTIGLNLKNRIGEFLSKKRIPFDIESKVILKVRGRYLSFKILSLDFKDIIHIKHIKGVLKRKLEEIKIPIKSLKKFNWFVSIKSLKFKNSGVLVLKVVIARWIIVLLILLLLLREIGILLIEFYQKFISPYKGYRCAKGLLYKNGTCSSVTKKAFIEKGFIEGMKTYFASTKECKKAHKILSKKKEKDSIVCNTCTEAGCEVCSSPLIDAVGSSVPSCDLGCSSCGVGSC